MRMTNWQMGKNYWPWSNWLMTQPELMSFHKFCLTTDYKHFCIPITKDLNWRDDIKIWDNAIWCKNVTELTSLLLGILSIQFTLCPSIHPSSIHAFLPHSGLQFSAALSVKTIDQVHFIFLIWISKSLYQEWHSVERIGGRRTDENEVWVYGWYFY